LLFLGAALESSAFLGFIVPGETIVILGGVLASAGLLGLPETITAVVAGAIIGDSIGYELGRHLGRPWLQRHGRLVGMHGGVLARADELFAHHGGKAVIIGRFVGFLRAMAPFVAGASRMPYRRFVVYNALGALVWGPACVLLGYSLGTSWAVAERWIGRGGTVIGVIAVAAALLWLRRHRRARPPGRADSG